MLKIFQGGLKKNFFFEGLIKKNKLIYRIKLEGMLSSGLSVLFYKLGVPIMVTWINTINKEKVSVLHNYKKH